MKIKIMMECAYMIHVKNYINVYEIKMKRESIKNRNDKMGKELEKNETIMELLMYDYTVKLGMVSE